MKLLNNIECSKNNLNLAKMHSFIDKLDIKIDNWKD